MPGFHYRRDVPVMPIPLCSYAAKLAYTHCTVLVSVHERDPHIPPMLFNWFRPTLLCMLMVDVLLGQYTTSVFPPRMHFLTSFVLCACARVGSVDGTKSYSLAALHDRLS